MASLLTHRQLAVVLARQLTSFTHISFLSPFRDADPVTLTFCPPRARQRYLQLEPAASMISDGKAVVFGAVQLIITRLQRVGLVALGGPPSRGQRPSASRPGSPRRSRGWG
jgi:hypothetical protein